MKKLAPGCLLAVMLIACNNILFAQNGVPAQYAADYNTMMKNNATALINNQPRYTLFNLSSNTETAANVKYPFLVMFKDSSQLLVESKMYIDTLRHAYYLLLVDKSAPKKNNDRQRKIYPGETLQISRMEAEPRTLVTGYAADSCWLFKIISGKINAYSHLSELDYLNSIYIDFIQPGNSGAITTFTPQLLTNLVQGNSKAVHACKKGEYYKAIVKYNG